jgi:hypothetical protein
MIPDKDEVDGFKPSQVCPVNNQATERVRLPAPDIADTSQRPAASGRAAVRPRELLHGGGISIPSAYVLLRSCTRASWRAVTRGQGWQGIGDLVRPRQASVLLLRSKPYATCHFE